MMNDDLKRLRDFSMEPDERLWSSIMSTVALQDQNVRVQRRTKKGWLFLALSLVLGGFFFALEPPRKVVTRESFTKPRELGEGLGVHPAGSSKETRDERTTNTKSEVNEHIPSEVKDATTKAGAAFRSATGPPPLDGLSTSRERDQMLTFAAKGEEAWSQNQHNDFNADGLVKKEGIELSGRVDGHSDNGSAIETKSAVPKKKTDDSVAVEQSIIVKQQKKKRVTRLYFTAMPTLGYQRIEANAHDNLIVESINKVAAFSPDRLGVRAEAGLEIPVYGKLNAFGGLVYYQREQTIGYVEKHVEHIDVVNGPDGQIITKPQFTYVEKSFEYQVRNMGLQVGLNYQLKTRSLLHTVGTGVEFHVALNRKSQPNPDFTNNPSVYVFYNLYYRLQYPADTKLRAVFQPTLNYSFYINEVVNAPFYIKPYGLGLNLGATYHF